MGGTGTTQEGSSARALGYSISMHHATVIGRYESTRYLPTVRYNPLPVTCTKYLYYLRYTLATLGQELNILGAA
jgi:hypothetical protein